MIRSLLVYLVISGTLVSSLAVTGHVYASLKKIPGTDIVSLEGPTEDESTDEATEDESTDDETTSELPATKTKGEFLTSDILDLTPADKAKILPEILVDEGDLSPDAGEAIGSILSGNSEESKKGLVTLCNIVSTDESSNIDPSDCTNALESSGGDTTSDTGTVENTIIKEIVKFILAELATSGTIMTGDEIKDFCTKNPENEGCPKPKPE